MSDNKDELEQKKNNLEKKLSSKAINGSIDDIVSIVRHENSNNRAKTAPLWLITFTDVMALMLTFFVLLYAMSTPDVERWEELSVSLSSKFKDDGVKPYNTGSQDVIAIDKIGKSKALDLSYLKVLVSNLLKSRGVDDVFIFQNAGRLVISMPSDLLFESASADVSIEGKKALFALGGALSRVKNRIEIVGHTDPRPITGSAGGYKDNWELSLARSSAVALVLRNVGYDRNITVRGVSSARYDELPEDVPENKRNDFSRRVDIIIMNDSGFKTKIYGLQ